MKNFKKWMAFAAAAVMCLSLGTTAFAATDESPTDDSLGYEEDGTPTTETEDDYFLRGAYDKDGNMLPVEVRDMDESAVVEINTNEKIKDIMADAGYSVPDDVKAIVLNQYDLKLPEGVEMPEGGLDINFNIYDMSLKAGDIVYVLHQNADGTWDVQEVEIQIENGARIITAHFDSFSPVALIALETADGKNYKAAYVGNKTQPTGKVSPKTGE